MMFEQPTTTAGPRWWLAACLLSLAGCAWDDPFCWYNQPGANPPISGTMIPTPPLPAEAPRVAGSQLQVTAAESAAGQVLGLKDELATAQRDNERLAAQVRTLETDLDASRQSLSRALDEVRATRRELAGARSDLTEWKEEIAVLRKKLDAADRENLSTLQTTVGLLQELVGRDEPEGESEDRPEETQPTKH